MFRTDHVLCCALLLSGAAACKKADKADNGDKAAMPAGAPAPAAGPVAQAGLKANVLGKDLGPLYGIAQPNPREGNSHRLTFSTLPIDCASFIKVMEGAKEGDSFWIRAHEALRPDGTLTWVYGGIAFGSGGSAPANLTAMPAYKVDGGRVTGTLPSEVGHEVEGGQFAVTGDFSVPVCGPLLVPDLEHVTDRKQPVVPIEAKGSTARVTVAGKSFAVKGATALRSTTRDGVQWMIRLSEQPHGCSDAVPGDLILGIRITGPETKLFLAGNWVTGDVNVVALDGTLKVDMKPGTGTVELALSGAMDYVPNSVPYKLEVSGHVIATACVVP